VVTGVGVNALLARLWEDDRLRERLECDPEAVLTEFGVSAVELPSPVELPPKAELERVLKTVSRLMQPPHWCGKR